MVGMSSSAPDPEAAIPTTVAPTQGLCAVGGYETLAVRTCTANPLSGVCAHHEGDYPPDRTPARLQIAYPDDILH